MGMDDPELEERIIQHLAAAATIGRTHRMAWREGPRRHASSYVHGIPVRSAQPNRSSAGSGEEAEPAAATGNTPPLRTAFENNGQHMSYTVESNQISGSSSGSVAMPSTVEEASTDNR